MARKPKKDRRRKKKRGDSTVPRRRRDGGEAFKGMLVGGALCAFFALFFFLRVAGDTPFNHFVALFEAPVEQTKAKEEKKTSGPSQIPTRIGGSSTNSKTAPPLETLTDGDKAGLDSLIKSKTGNK